MSFDCYKTHLLQFQPTPFCNLDCSYCYLPGRDRHSKMAIDVPAITLKRLSDAGCLGDRLDIAWHAGEPLVLPIEYYIAVFDRIEAVTPPGLRITHHFQTNATLISDEFCRFVKTKEVSVGVSLDGPEDIHDSKRPARGGGGTHKLVMKGVERLRAHEIPFSTITVLTKSTLQDPDILFDFFSSQGIQRVCFNLERIVGAHESTSLDHDDYAIVKRFFARYIELLGSGETRQWVREIDGRLELLFSGAMSEDKQSQSLAIVTVNWKGELSTFSPEFLDANHPRYGSFVFGNVFEDKIESILKSEKLRRVNADIQKGVSACRRTCGYFGVCGGGSPATKLAENDTFESTETVSCRLGIKAITDVLLDHVENAVAYSIPAR